MKKTFFFASAVLTLFAFTTVTSWKSDKAHSHLGFSITHLGINEVNGNFKDFDVNITSSKADFSDAVFDVTADVASINTGIEMRDKHLASADFFNAEKNPRLTFKSSTIIPAGEKKYKLTGNLSLNGITKPVTLDLWYRGTVENPMSKAPTSGFQVTGIIKRSDFNLGSGFSAPMLSDEVKIKADGEFAKQ
jgi:polyisoprenoid-binding protein YceI